MVTGRISSRTKEKFRRSIRDVVKGLSRKVKVYKQPIIGDCPNCFYDKLTNSSTGKCKWSALEARTLQQEYEVSSGEINLKYKYFKVGRCPVCKGKGYLEEDRVLWIDCLVIWDPSNRNSITFTPAGTEGSTVVELKTDPKYFNIFKNCSKIFVDNIPCSLSKPPLLRGLGNNSVLVITAFTTDKVNIDRNEILKKY